VTGDDAIVAALVAGIEAAQEQNLAVTDQKDMHGSDQPEPLTSHV
jgi:hypothetical protein